MDRHPARSLPGDGTAAGSCLCRRYRQGDGAGNIGGGQADYVYFGNYYQSNGSTKDPVKWRVLSNANGQLFLLSDQNLDVFQYHTEKENVTWETSTMRSWSTSGFSLSIWQAASASSTASSQTVSACASG